MLSLRLHTHALDEQRVFYGQTLGLEIIDAAKAGFSVRAGDSVIEFIRGEGGVKPFYHFALNISANKMPLAHAWISARCPLLTDRETGDDLLFFAAWNAHSVYFHDPAGNIVELIARHTIANDAPGAFEPADIHGVSEIGLVVRDRADAIRRITNAFELTPYHDSEFFLGDEHGLILLPEPGYLWLPERRKAAAVFPTVVTIPGRGPGRVRLDGLPYEIAGT